MTKLEFDVLDDRKEMDSMKMYAVLTGAIENEENYEGVLKHEDSCGLFSIYRHAETTATIVVHSESSGEDSAYLSLIGEKDKIKDALKGIESIILKRIKLKQISESEK